MGRMFDAYGEWAFNAWPWGSLALVVIGVSAIAACWDTFDADDATALITGVLVLSTIGWMPLAVLGPPAAILAGWGWLIHRTARAVGIGSPRPSPDEYVKQAQQEVERLAPEESR